METATPPSVTKDTNLGELSRTYPAAAKMLQEDYGLHCVSCIANTYDTLETGLRVHGYSDTDISEAVEEVNRHIYTSLHAPLEN